MKGTRKFYEEIWVDDMQSRVYSVSEKVEVTSYLDYIQVHTNLLFPKSFFIRFTRSFNKI
jgi:hypothetical protein